MHKKRKCPRHPSQVPFRRSVLYYLPPKPVPKKELRALNFDVDPHLYKLVLRFHLPIEVFEGVISNQECYVSFSLSQVYQHEILPLNSQDSKQSERDVLVENVCSNVIVQWLVGVPRQLCYSLHKCRLSASSSPHESCTQEIIPGGNPEEALMGAG